ncbi:RNA-binding protein [Clostridiales bacterium F-3ap]|uniref:RNA-binding protein n=1 Tax=Anaerotalea alkaliphila TaxID=2662126 RepID=A0A7X5KNU9_9FIRM|nr:RNA-binding protein [Anaerotalea alkaliphila]
MEVGRTQTLEVARLATMGIFLKEKEGKAEDAVLLPKNQVPEEVAVGQMLEVFVYKDSQDRAIATRKTPRLTLDSPAAKLEVVDKTEFGAFLDWGLEKHLFLPYKQQTEKVKLGDQVLVSLYVDKSGRLCGTMDVYDLLRDDSPYKVDDMVEGTVHALKDFGALVAVDNLYHGMVPDREVHGNLAYGETRSFRVTKVREDGKLDLSPQAKAHIQMDADSKTILEVLEHQDGFLALTDQSSPEEVARELGMSKKAFKRAVGKLYKEKRILLEDRGIRLVSP